MSMTAQGKVTPFGNRSANGSNGSEASYPDLAACVRFPVCRAQKQAVGFRPVCAHASPSAERAVVFKADMLAGEVSDAD